MQETPESVRIDVAGHVDAEHFLAVLDIAEYLLRRDAICLDHLLIVIHLVQKDIQRFDPLAPSSLDLPPLTGGNDFGAKPAPVENYSAHANIFCVQPLANT